jgi:ribokinase
MSGRVLNIGSLNIDFVYHVEAVAAAGQTVSARRLERFPGGKGANQSCALARAGAPVHHAGCIGADGRWLLDALQRDGVGTDRVAVVDEPTGHAVIQVDRHGENAIVLFGGANHRLDRERIDAALSGFGPGDTLLLQNEVCETDHLLRAGRRAGLAVAFNPAPCTPALRDLPLELVDCLIVNQSEAETLGDGADPETAFQALAERLPEADLLLTLGAGGVRARIGGEALRVPAPRVETVDTTAAGDTFIGFYLAARRRGDAARPALTLANRAAALCATRPGAQPAIPTLQEVEQAYG